MRKPLIVVASLLILATAVPKGRAADSTCEFSVQASASVEESPPRIMLSWPQDTCTRPNAYTVFRKGRGANSWGVGIALPATATSYVDNDVAVGTPYEYQIVKNTASYKGYGYVYAGINVPLTDNRGRLLLVVDKTYAPDLASELA